MSPTAPRGKKFQSSALALFCLFLLCYCSLLGKAPFYKNCNSSIFFSKFQKMVQTNPGVQFCADETYFTIKQWIINHFWEYRGLALSKNGPTIFGSFWNYLIHSRLNYLVLHQADWHKNAPRRSVWICDQNKSNQKFTKKAKLWGIKYFFAW